MSCYLSELTDEIDDLFAIHELKVQYRSTDKKIGYKYYF